MKEFDFYIVPTPIGNLSDISHRALEILSRVDIIACEDMRVTQKLLNHFSISTKCISYHKFNEKERVEKFIELIKSGKKMALVSDAGTPLFCDPGAILVKELKKHGISITALPGANAVVTFLSQVPRESEEFAFVGFLPKSKSQITDLLIKYKNTDMVFYESPNRLKATLEVIATVNPQKTVSIGRELTKIFEEIITDNVSNIIKYFEENVLKGEIVGMVHASQLQSGAEQFKDEIKALSDKGFSAKDISMILSVLYDANKNDIYSYILNVKKM